MAEQSDKTTTRVIKPPLNMPTTTPMKVLIVIYICVCFDI